MNKYDAIQQLKGMVALRPDGPQGERELDVALKTILAVYEDADDKAIITFLDSLTEDQTSELSILATATIFGVIDAVAENRPAMLLPLMYYFAARAALMGGKNV